MLKAADVTNLLSCYAKPVKEPPRPRSREMVYSSPERSVSGRSRAEVIITHTSSTSDACETYAQSVEKPIVSLTPSVWLVFSFSFAFRKGIGEAVNSALREQTHQYYATIALVIPSSSKIFPFQTSLSVHSA